MERQEQFNVIVYGIGGTLKQSIEYIRFRYNMVGCSDKNPEKASEEMVRDIPYYPPGLLRDISYDYILITSDFDDAISKYLQEEIGIAEEKILKREQWYRMLFHYSFGEKNPEKTFYVMSKPIRVKNGLMSNVLCFLEQLDYVEKMGYIPVADMQSYSSQYLESWQIGKVNAWEYYYEPMSAYTLEEVYQSKNVIMGYDDNCYMQNYQEKYDIPRLSQLYHKYIKIRSDAAQIIHQEYEKIFGKKRNILGVLYRGTDMVSLKLKHHAIQPAVDEMKELMHQYLREWQCEYIFLCTEDQQALEVFKKEFGDRLLYTDQVRFSNTGNQWLAQIDNARENDRYLRGLEYLTTIQLLSRCDYLLAGVCSGSVCSLIMNGGKYKAVQMVDKGVYSL